jgi:GNAT superfamily N-acetyltransferase
MDVKYYAYGEDALNTPPESVQREICKLDCKVFDIQHWQESDIRRLMLSGITVVAKVRGHVVGCLIGRLYVHTFGLNERRVAFYVNTISVLPAMQRKGIGSRLIYELEGRLKGTECVSAIVLSALSEAEPFYDKLAFTKLSSGERIKHM